MLFYLLQFLVIIGALYIFCIWRQKRRLVAKKSPNFDSEPGDMEIKKNGVVFKILYTLYSRTRVGHWYTKKSVQKAKLRFPDGHSVLETFAYGNLQITPIAVNFDNYTYLIVDIVSGDCVLVDLSDLEPVEAVLKAKNLKPTAVLTTHKHWDHCYGNGEFKRIHSDVEIYGAKTDKPHNITKCVKHKDEISIGSLRFTCLLTPGHTSGHMIYHLNGSDHRAPDSIFTGDLLFLGGLGRMFEGSAKTMLNSLELLLVYGDESLIWPGHEYAKENTDFTSKLDPDNSILSQKRLWILTRRHDLLPTCPSTLGEEKQYNPFLRTHDPDLLKILNLWPELETDSRSEKSDSPATVVDMNMKIRALKALRVKKDAFKPKIVVTNKASQK